MEKAHAQYLRHGISQQELARAGIFMNSSALRQAQSRPTPQPIIPARPVLTAQPVWILSPVKHVGRVPSSSATATSQTVRMPPANRGGQSMPDGRRGIKQSGSQQSSQEHKHEQRTTVEQTNDDSVILLDSSIDTSVVEINSDSESCHIDDHNNSALTTDGKQGAENSSRQETDGTNALNGSSTGKSSASVSLSDTDSGVQQSRENANKNSIIAGPSTPSSPPDSPFSCTVLNCEAEFSSEGQLGHHMNLFKHSPCNPCLKARNCKLPPDPLCYICPECNKEFQTLAECRRHMKRREHCPFYEPLSIGGYICPQCLLIFHSFPACWYHMEKSLHHNLAYQFPDDCGPRGVTNGPLGVGEELIQDLIDQCGKIPFNVQCLECLLDIKNAARLRQHMQETQNQHLVSALCETSVVDLFSSYLATYSCDRCHRLFHTNKTKIHRCAEGYMGRIIENDVHSFADFIKRCALTLRKIDLPSPIGPSKVEPGTSGIPIPPDDDGGSISGEDVNGDSGLRTSETPKTSTGNVSVSDEYADSESEQGPVGTSTQPSGVVKSCNSRDYMKNEPEPTIAATSVTSSPGDGISAAHADSDSEAETSATSRARSSCTSSEPVRGDPKPGTSGATRSRSNVDDCSPVGTTGPGSDGGSCSPVVCFEVDSSDSDDTETSDSDSDSDCLMVEDVDKQANKNGSPKADDHSIIEIDDDADETTVSRSEAKRKRKRWWEEAKKRKKLKQQKKNMEKRMNRKRKKAQLEQLSACKRPRSQSPSGPTSDTNLSRMKNIIFLDLDNWPGFFSKLPRCLPDRTFVWGFFGGRNVWNEPHRCYVFNQLKTSGNFFLNKQCGNTKDAADFAIVLTVGKYHERLPNSVSFTIMSGDKGFIEVERQMKDAERKTFVIDPHRAHQFSNDMVYAMITSVLET